MLRSLATSRLTNKTVRFAFAKETRQELLALKHMIERKALRAVVDRTYPMSRAAEAHRRVETEQRLGAVVVAVDA